MNISSRWAVTRKLYLRRKNTDTNWVREIKVQKEKPRGDIERSFVTGISFHSPAWTWIYRGRYQMPLRVELKSSYTVLPKKLPSSWPPFLLSQREKSELIRGIRTAMRMSWSLPSKNCVNQSWSSPAHLRGHLVPCLQKTSLQSTEKKAISN